MQETSQPQERLLAGMRKFQQEVYPGQRAVYEQVMRVAQKPHTLFITCADSRVDPGTLTQSKPGEIFVTRNIGNVVPAHGESLGGVAAVIEYAVAALGVGHIVVCGHSDCGAMKGLLSPHSVDALPAVKGWLQNAAAALSVVEAREGHGSHTLDALIEENVLQQIAHLRTHPAVAGKLAAGTLTISGWVYDIAAGTVRIYDESGKRFTNAAAA